MTNYYERLKTLRDQLVRFGRPDVAEELLQAERGGTTSSEILANTHVILRRLLDSGDADRFGLGDTIAHIDDLGRDLFNSTNRKF